MATANEAPVHVVFILVEPETPANIGSAARALKTMGFSSLRIVQPKCEPLEGKAQALAHGSQDILASAEVFCDLEAALKDVEFVIGCTARHRKRKRHYLASQDLKDFLQQRPFLKRVAILFGGETSGLSSRHIDRCDMLTTIPLATTNPSLNLAQAVMLYSYELRFLNPQVRLQTQDHRIDREPVAPLEYQRLVGNVKRLILSLELANPNPILQHVTYALARLGKDDLYLVQELRKRLAAKIGVPEHD